MIVCPVTGVENCFVIVYLFISSVSFRSSDVSGVETCVFPLPAFGAVQCSPHLLCAS